MHCGQKIENIMSKVMNLDTSKMVNMMAFLIAILTPSIVSSGKWPPLDIFMKWPITLTIVQFIWNT